MISGATRNRNTGVDDVGPMGRMEPAVMVVKVAVGQREPGVAADPSQAHDLGEQDRWVKFFKEGADLDLDDLPAWMNTPEMRQVMSTMTDFSEKDRAAAEQARAAGEQAHAMAEHACAAEAREREAKERALAEVEALRRQLGDQSGT
jgi:hypothetical protein